MVDFAALDVIAEEFWHPDDQPGLAFGVVRDGELVHWGGLGRRYIGGPAPDADTVFRISSMTKSFTAAAIMLLRDEGLLAMDDLAEEYVPEMRGWPPVTAESARVTVRHYSPARCRWWLTGERGTVQAQIMLSPEKPPRVQSLSVAVPPAPGSALADALARVIGWLNGGQPVPTGEGLDPVLASRRVRSAAAWAGTCHPGPPRAGDGASTVTVQLTGEYASLTLAIGIDPATGLFHRLDLSGG